MSSSKVYLASGVTGYNIANNDDSVYGLGSTTETITIGSSVTGVVADGNIDQVNFALAITSYQFAQAGNLLKVYASNGTTLVTTIAVGDTAAKVSFNSGTAVNVTLAAGVMKIDGHTIGSTAAVLDTTAPTVASSNPITNTDTGSDSTGVYAAGDKITLTFSEPVNTSLAIGDITLNNSHTFGTGAVLAAVSASGGYATSFTITLGSNPTVAASDTISVAIGKAVDAASNANTAAVTFTVPAMTAPTVSGTAAELAASSAALVTAVANPTVTITGATNSVADANTVDASTTGVITGTLTAGNLASFSALTGTNNAYAITVSDSVTTSNVADLITLDGKTTGVITASLAGTAAELNGLQVGSNDYTVTLSGATNSVADANTVDASTTGVITGTLTTGALATFSTLTGTNNVYAITVSDSVTTSNVADLITLDGKTTGVITASLAGTAAELNGLQVGSNDYTVTLSGATNSVADANKIDASTTGVITGTLTAGNLASFSALTGTNNAYAITVNDAGSRADTDTLLAKTTGVVTTGALTAETYANFATNDKIATGLTFATHTSDTLANDSDLEWNFNAGTLTFETTADSNANVELVLTGITSVTESDGVFTLTYS